MKKLILAVFLAIALSPASAHALQFMKCNTIEGKTIYATFAKASLSGEPAPRFFPLDIVVFRAPQQLQDRVLFKTFEDGLKIPVVSTAVQFQMAFSAKGPSGELQTEALDLRLFSRDDPTGFTGIWSTTAGSVQTKQNAYCSLL